jgi:uncharacterized protein (TIGR00730 family)
MDVDSSAQKHQRMGAHLSRIVEEGKKSVPETHEPLVCKPREIEPWRVFKIMSEFVEGFDLLKKYGTAVTFFGSTQRTFEDHFYKEATELSGRLAKQGFVVITGGSAGIMEAANKGAYEAGGTSVGLNIRLNEAQPSNGFVTESLLFDHFFVRKTMLTFASEVYVYFPGGFGTLDEFFEIVTLVQTKKIRAVPIVVYGREYWEPLIEFFKTKMLKEHAAIKEEDLNIFTLVDSVDEAYDFITKNVKC